MNSEITLLCDWFRIYVTNRGWLFPGKFPDHFFLLEEFQKYSQFYTHCTEPNWIFKLKHLFFLKMYCMHMIISPMYVKYGECMPDTGNTAKQTLKYSMFVKPLEIWLLFIFQQLFKHCILENIVCSIVLVPIRVTSIVWRDDNWVTLHNSWTALNPSTLSSVYRPGALGADFVAGLWLGLAEVQFFLLVVCVSCTAL